MIRPPNRNLDPLTRSNLRWDTQYIFDIDLLSSILTYKYFNLQLKTSNNPRKEEKPKQIY